ncbi:PREDICTED: probable G-protein coupled receptor 135 [Acropora digitifera]|uniref:probable G-protein coupled receptor 135 n=1 Tax=Acropora digitifera TaxID=70779 RepID=UPI00077B1937|nr:PREDICTED: probable G-protein coupled receptor 135 [Acropora digitifera]
MASWNHTAKNLSNSDLLSLAFDASVASSVTAKVFKILPLTFITLASSIGNAILIYAVYADVRMRTATNMLIASQGIADLGTSILVMPFALVSVVADSWILGEKFCMANAFFNLFFTQTTVLHMTIIAFERYLVIVKALLCEISLFRATGLAAFAWGLSFLTSLPWLDWTTDQATVEYFEGYYVCGIRYHPPVRGLALPLVFITFCYHKIRKIIRKKNHSVCPMAQSNAQKLAINVYASSALTSKFVIGTSLIQVFPACFLMLLDGLRVGCIPRDLRTGFKWVMWCHCFVKPTIYASKNPAWRKTIGGYLQKIPFCSLQLKPNAALGVYDHYKRNSNLPKGGKVCNNSTQGHKETIQTEIEQRKLQVAENYKWFFRAKEAWQDHGKRQSIQFSTF